MLSREIPLITGLIITKLQMTRMKEFKGKQRHERGKGELEKKSRNEI